MKYNSPGETILASIIVAMVVGVAIALIYALSS